ncbi:MAG: beta-ketoacyl synthase [Chitinophagaceae bacterium]|nr:beta-ketoacyl synthase [Chitinophagaceae bacterium]
MSTHSPIFIGSSAIISSIGEGSYANFDLLKQGVSGIQFIDDPLYVKDTLPLAKIKDEFMSAWKARYQTASRFDSMLLACLDQFKQTCDLDLSLPEVQIILSTTKGNIELLEDAGNQHQLPLTYSASLIKQHTNNPNEVLIVSNACISGISATVIGRRLIQSGEYKHVLIVGADVLTKFVISGFSAFHALSKSPCKPFDLNRQGVTLGEAAACLLLSCAVKSSVIISGGCISNDANHISGPSKTGEELAYCITKSLDEAQLKATDVDFISAHGTATPYNDEMESKAFELSQLSHAPVFSLKGNYGHTLGAAGVLEIAIASMCLTEETLLASKGYDELGVSGKITMSRNTVSKNLRVAVKTGSGFGGCNAAVVLETV